MRTEKQVQRTTWKPVWGERAEIPDNFNQLILTIQPTGNKRGTLQIIVRAYNEGIAFRYFFPKDINTQIIEIGAERTEFNLPVGTSAFWTPGAQQE